MPTYQYVCTSCGERLEVVQKFTDEPLTECPTCQGRLRKVFSSVGVVFKGSGFYRTDSRAAANGAKSESREAADKSSSGSAGTSGGSTESAAAPAGTAKAAAG
ncbi:putative regulatory protein, FmdB family [Acidothermus cellulolyticus 11B]|uniref:Putative regulatory protein, FmdB family n=1 Tax=Acidothermus cellulolyticus (strain ATCC 43068 / DSM 8971 / 11B) TaxID=351607 RepID=A0LR76_ACIC1|nr:FmdB family zinc ribbon protein [Acidothermus cellulolyticus]ABK51936.1 putative regulatory protein, FmdB family [Acidothermus cellulolyticus 11B]